MSRPDRARHGENMGAGFLMDENQRLLDSVHQSLALDAC